MNHSAPGLLGRWMRRSAVVAVPVVLAAALSGCIWAQGSSRLAESEKLQQQAQAALTRWADAVAAAGGGGGIVLVGDLTGQVGVWEPSVGDNKQALMAGLVEAAVSLPTATSEGKVTWPDGTSKTVPVMSAEQAVAAIRAEAPAKDCPGCLPLKITGARLTSGQVTTSRGSAMAPVWEFTIRGTDVKVTRVAIASAMAVALPPWNGPPWGNGGDAPVGISVDAATATAGGRELTVGFGGAPLAGDRACGADYTAEAVESSLAVVVIVTAHPNPLPAACALIGAPRTAVVRLAAPLGERTVLEVTQGLPIMVTAG